MEISHDLSEYLSETLRIAAQKVDGFDDAFEPQVRVADERFGDFQANGVLPFAKRKGQNPRALAEQLIQTLPPSEDWEVSLAGPGFVNFSLSPGFLLRWIQAYGSDDAIRGAGKVGQSRKIVLDYSSPNTAKQMHVGHIRSTIIGESLARLLEHRGHEVIRDNHLGDWGTQFGMLLLAIKREQVNLDELGDEPIARLENLYRAGNALTKEDESALTEAREELVKLQKGDPENLALWQKIRDLSMDSFERIYDLLGVRFDHAHGESFYRDQVDAVYAGLQERGICREDAGALVVFHPEHKRFAKQPFIIRKSDGASNYATTDLATLAYRTSEWRAEQVIYVTDGRQRDHFEQLFLTTEKWFGAENKTLPTSHPVPRVVRNHSRRRQQGDQNPGRRTHQADRPAQRSHPKSGGNGAGKEPRPCRGGNPKEGPSDRIGSGQVRRPFSGSDPGLRLLLGQAPGDAGQHRPIPAVCGGPDQQHLQKIRRRPLPHLRKMPVRPRPNTKDPLPGSWSFSLSPWSKP